ncbi:helix-turn-helix domain-containing protein [Paracoccus jiaweipingae]|uniref:helix-turn-helix domain-containing protein n=1 Tax=unclassified Paracoccus (in: a-proteobacteria) TaxID=2688777 RepID=UPI00378CB454
MGCPTHAKTPIENIGEYRELPNPKNGVAQENPGALAGATGADLLSEKEHRKASLKRPHTASGNGLRGEWGKARWGWKRAIRRDERLSRAAKLIGLTLVDDFANHATGRCIPFVATICEATGDSERTVQRGLGELEACGWIVRSKGHGRGRPSAITFTADPAKGAIIPENVTEMAAHQDAGRAAYTAKRVPPAAPLHTTKSAKGVPEMAEKGATRGGSHSEPRMNQNARAGADARASGAAQRPVTNLQAVAHHGSDREADWNRWLSGRGYPTLAELGMKSSDAQGRGWEVPFRRPSGGGHELRITEQYFAWAMSRMEVRLASTG